MVAVNSDLIEMHAPVRTDDQISAGIDFGDNTGDTDRIEAVLLKILAAVIGPEHHKNDLFALKRGPPGHLLISVDREKDIGIGDDDHVIYGYNCHILIFLLKQ